MPKLHLTKVAFRCASVETLERRMAARAKDGEIRVATRLRPKRAEELIDGSLYWIVKHRMVACQRILRFEDRKDGRIDIVCAAELAIVAPSPKRAHQGWRYLEEGSEPPGEGDSAGLAQLPGRLYGKLAALALV